MKSEWHGWTDNIVAVTNGRTELRRLGGANMLFSSLLLAFASTPDNSGYIFIERACVAQNDGHDPIFWGLGKGQCEDVEEADQLLNRAYRLVLTTVGNARRMQLRNAQRQWLKTIIVKCKLDPGGTVSDRDMAECYIRESERRTVQLRNMRRS